MKFFKCATITLGLSALIASAYVVKEGDTLWDLSDEYLHDPFAWPDLWENNRHIQDPHWIYPGDSIYLGDSLRDEPVMVIPADKKKYPCKAAVADSNLPKGQGYKVENAGCDENDERNGEFENMLGNLRDKDKKQKKKRQEADSEDFQRLLPNSRTRNLHAGFPEERQQLYLRPFRRKEGTYPPYSRNGNRRRRGQEDEPEPQEG